jgi:hypothetical protein
MGELTTATLAGAYGRSTVHLCSAYFRPIGCASLQRVWIYIIWSTKAYARKEALVSEEI